MTTVQQQENWYLALSLDCDDHDGFGIADILEEKFRDDYSGSGFGGFGRDIGFFGPKKNLLKIQKYVERHYKSALLVNDLEVTDY